MQEEKTAHTDSIPSLKSFGDYEIIEETARGGMGVVFKARQRSLNRTVAVKMILSGHLASEAEAQRFRAEARAAAALQHPGIVAIHEVGEHDGLLFFSMDYVEGQNLAQVVRDGPLSAQRAAECVREIANAIHYAHERGVLHRDLKPSNILIDQVGKLHVTDFGLAKQLNPDSQLATQDPQLTLSGQVLGSPNFMPPEQAAGRHRELTPAADVYSLGALLYHLITGRPPFLADSIPATLRLVSEAEPVPPRLLAPAVPRDLETICLKCLDKGPQRRYAGADDLAEELQRFLDHEPIHARPIGAVGRLWRWARRNPGLARTATAALLLCFAVTIGGPIALVQINDARKQAETRQKEATLEATRSQQFAQFMKAMLRSAGPSVARGRDATLLRELLEKTAARLETELRNQPEVLGDMYATLGSTYRDIGDYQHAIPMLEKAVAKYREAFHGDHKKLAFALGYLGQYQSFNTDVAAGKSSAQAGLEMARRCGDPETLANCLLNVARSFEGWGMTATQGFAYAREAADWLRKLTNNPTALADCYSFMAGATQDGDRAEAERLARAALELHSKNLDPDHPSVVSDIFMLGQVQLDRGKFAEAETNLGETLRLFRKIYDEKHPHRPIVMRLLGEALTKQGKQAELESAYREEITSFGEHPAPSETVAKFVAILEEHSKHPEADQLVQDYTARLVKKGSTNDLLVAELLNTLANRAAEEKQFDEGAKLSRQALEIQLKIASNNLPQLIATLGHIAAMLDNAGKYSEAEPVLQKRLELQRRLYGNDNSEIGDSLSWMAWVYNKDKKLSEEESLLQQRLAIQKKHSGVEHTNLIETLDRLAGNLEIQRKLNEAEAVRQQSLTICEKNFGESHPKTIGAEAKLIQILSKNGKMDEAERLGRQLIEQRKKTLGDGNAQTINARFNLVSLLIRHGKPDQAAAVCREMAEKYPDAAGHFYARGGQWKEAAAAFARRTESRADQIQNYRLLALILLFGEDVKGYRRVCQQIIDRFKATTDPGTADQVVRLCLLRTDSGLDLDIAASLANTDLANTEVGRNKRRPWAELARSLVEYRQDHYGEAISWAQKALASQGELERDACTYPVLAMAQWRLKQHDSARIAFKKAAKIIDSELPKLDSGDNGNWSDNIGARVLLCEASELLKGAAVQDHDPSDVNY